MTTRGSEVGKGGKPTGILSERALTLAAFDLRSCAPGGGNFHIQGISEKKYYLAMQHYMYIALIPILPLAGFVLLGLFGRKYFSNLSGILGTAILLLSSVLSSYAA